MYFSSAAAPSRVSPVFTVSTRYEQRRTWRHRRMRQTRISWTIVPVLAVAFAGACAPSAPAPGLRGTPGDLSPSWAASAYRSQGRDDAWHFAYAVQSWAAEQSGHIVMIPARYTIVVTRGFFSDEF